MTKKQLFIPALILFFLSFFLYVNTLTYNYSGDDNMFIAENSITLAGFGRISEIFTDDGTINGWTEYNKTSIEEQGFRKRYRPIPQMTFAAEVALFGLKPGFSHFINVLLYSLSVIMIFIVLGKLQLTSIQWYKSFAFWAAVLFAVHPIHTECVANIKSRDEILAFFFFLISLLIAYKVERKYLKFISVFFFYLLALLSKENAITYMAIVPLFLYFSSKGKITFREHLRFISPFLLAAGFFLILSFGILNNEKVIDDVFSNYFFNLSASEKIGTIMVSLGKYLQLLFLPVTLLCDYSVYQIPVMKITQLLPVCILILHLILILIAFKTLKNRSIYCFAILFYFITMSLYSNVIFNTGNAVAERFLYTSSLGFCIAVSFFLFNHLSIFIRKSNFLFSLILLIPILTFFSYKTITRTGDWKDYNTLITKDISKKNNCARLNYSFAELYFNEKQKNEKNPDSLRVATTYYLKSVEIYPKYIRALNQLGLCYYLSDKYDSSANYYYQSLLIKPEQLSVFKNISLVLDSMKKDSKVIEFRKKLIIINPELAPLYYYLGRDYEYFGKKDSAIFYLKKALERKPDFKKAEAELNKLESKF